MIDSSSTECYCSPVTWRTIPHHTGTMVWWRGGMTQVGYGDRGGDNTTGDRWVACDRA